MKPREMNSSEAILPAQDGGRAFFLMSCNLGRYANVFTWSLFSLGIIALTIHFKSYFGQVTKEF